MFDVNVLAWNDTDLVARSPWRGVRIVTPAQFANRVDGMRFRARW